MVTYSMDAELFISEVSKQPAIWDLNCDENKLKKLKDKGWADIARAFVSGFDEMPESKKLDIYRKLQCKWRNLRDNYVRSMRRGDGGKRYTYSKNMAFLDAIYRHRTSRAEDRQRKRRIINVMKEDSSSQDDHYLSTFEDRLSSEDVSPAPKTNKVVIDGETILIKEESSSDEDIPSVIDNMKRKRRNTERPEFLEIPIDETEIRGPTGDEDKLFFDSLLPVVHEFDLDQKLEFRTQVLQLLKSIRSSQF